MKTSKISLSIILLSFAFSAFGQSVKTPKGNMDSNKWQLASNEVIPGVEDKLSLDQKVMSQTIAAIPSEYGHGCVVPRISIQAEFQLPEVVFEPYMYVEDWMITPFYSYLSRHGKGSEVTLGEHLLKKAD